MSGDDEDEGVVVGRRPFGAPEHSQPPDTYHVPDGNGEPGCPVEYRVCEPEVVARSAAEADGLEPCAHCWPRTSPSAEPAYCGVCDSEIEGGLRGHLPQCPGRDRFGSEAASEAAPR